MRSSFGRVFQKPPRRGYYVRFRYRGREYERAGGPTKGGARALLSRMHGLLSQRVPIDEALVEVFGAPAGSMLSFHDAVPLYLEYARSRKRPTTLAAEAPRFGFIQRQAWAKRPLREVRQRDVSAFADELLVKGARGKPCKGSTVNRYLASISALYRWAIREGHATENPAQGVDRFDESEGAREVFLEAEEARALLAACSVEFHPIAAFALGTGCRRDEIVSLRWKDVHWKRDEVFIRAENSKTKRGRYVPLPEDLVALLRRQRRAQATRRLDGEDPVFQATDGTAWTWAAVRREFLVAVKACDGMAAWKAEILVFHDLRHTYASLAIQNGVPLHTLSRIMGHRSIQTTMRYAHLCAENRTAAAKVVGAALRNPAGEAGSRGVAGDG